MVGDNMNNKGFTLVELIATILILALVMSIASYSIINVIRNAKQKNYDLLIDHIKEGAELYYQECRYANNSGISCNQIDGGYEITLGELVTYGYLKGNKGDNRTKLINPLNDDDISACEITVVYSEGYLIISNNSSLESCPNNYSGIEVEFKPSDYGNILNPGIPVPTLMPRPNLK